jgi:hypothetical protein
LFRAARAEDVSLMLATEPLDPEDTTASAEHKFLRPGVIAAIEHALKSVGAFGEVHLIIERGRLRFIRTIISESIDRANR